jgi:hypothetical protein
MMFQITLYHSIIYSASINVISSIQFCSYSSDLKKVPQWTLSYRKSQGHIYIYIYIYICVCVCTCIYEHTVTKTQHCHIIQLKIKKTIHKYKTASNIKNTNNIL